MVLEIGTHITSIYIYYKIHKRQYFGDDLIDFYGTLLLLYYSIQCVKKFCFSIFLNYINLISN